MKNKRLITILMMVVLLLLIPLVAMQFTKEVNWSIADFILMGTLLLTTGLLSELVLRQVKNLSKRVIVCGVVLFAFFLVWVELAVGLFGTPFAGS